MLGFILPFALAFVGIPLESFIHSLRTVLGLVALGGLRALRLALRLVGGMANHLSRMLISLYDLFIMVPLSIERMVRYRRETAPQAISETSEQREPTAATEQSQQAGQKEMKPVAKTARPARAKRPGKEADTYSADDMPLTTGEV
jgi:hypothetical protein